MRVIAAAVLALSLATAGCTTPDGQPDPGATAGLALGLAALGGLAYIASQDDDGHRGRDRGRSYRSRDYRNNYDGYRRR